PKRQDEDVLAVEAAHRVVRKRRREVAVRRRRMDASEESPERGERCAELRAARECGIEPLRGTEVAEDEHAIGLDEAEDLGDDALDVDLARDLEVAVLED